MLEVHVEQNCTSFVEKNRFHGCVCIFSQFFLLFKKIKADSKRVLGWGFQNIGDVDFAKATRPSFTSTQLCRLLGLLFTTSVCPKSL